jgi:hypothetical protein
LHRLRETDFDTGFIQDQFAVLPLATTICKLPAAASYTGPFGETPLAPGQDPLLIVTTCPGLASGRTNQLSGKRLQSIVRGGSETPITRVAVP